MKTLAVFAAVTALSMPVAWAQDEEPAHGCPPLVARIIKAADTNGDRAVSLEEFLEWKPEASEAMFDRLDKNGDGAIDKQDIPKIQRKAFVRKLKHADTNDDGSVSWEEFSAEFPNATPEQFDRLDTSDDGLLNREDCIPIPHGGDGE